MPDATQNLKLKITSDTSQMRTAAGGFGAVTAAIAGITAALYAGKEAYKNFIEPVIQYNKEIKDASESTGMATEELSRFVQVGDDMGVSMGAVTKALEFATKNGFAPSIDSLAELADKGNAMSTTTERAAYYTKIFGRQWAELNPVLQLGGDRIRELAAAQADGLVVTEEEIRKTEDLRLGLDELNDNWIALRNEIVLSVTPALIQATQKQNFWQAALNLTTDDAKDLGRFLEDDLIPAMESVPTTVPTEFDMKLSINGQPATLSQIVRLLTAGGKPLSRNLRFLDEITGGVAGTGGPASSGSSWVNPQTIGQSALGGGRAQGGYLVGEHGAERFTPGTAGTLAPANDPLVRAINQMVRQLPVILRDAVQKA